MTYRDAIEHLFLYSGGSPQEQAEDRCRAAVQAAYQDLYLEQDWRYFTAHERINVSANYTTGTVSYVASTRTATISGGAWPTWAKDGQIRFADTGDVLYKVGSRTDADNIVLDATFCPQSNLSDQTFEIYQAVYPLPPDMRRMHEISDSPSQCWSSNYVTPEAWLVLDRHVSRQGRPWAWTLMGSEDYFGSLALYLYGRPATAQTFDFIYQRKARDLNYDGYSRYSSNETYPNNATPAQASTTAGSLVASLNYLTVPSGVVGSVIRMADSNGTEPPGGQGSAHQFNEQRIIQSTNGSTVTVGAVFNDTVSNGHFTISDPIDLPGYMHGAFRRRCEYELAVLQQNHKAVDRAWAMYQAALREAMARNAQVPVPEVACGWGGWVPSLSGGDMGLLSGTITANP